MKAHKHTATHPKFSQWETKRIQLDYPIHTTEKAVMVKGEIVKGAVWFPLSCVNIHGQFEVEVPMWMLRDKGLSYLTATN